MDFKEEIVKILKKELKLKEISLEVPPSSEMGDYAFPCFPLAKIYKKDPNEIAQELARKIPLKSPIKKIEIAGPYLNFFVDKTKLIQAVMGEIVKKKTKFGFSSSKKKKIMLEYFHANTHKAIHIGHIRNVSLGESLAKILAFDGYYVQGSYFLTGENRKYKTSSGAFDRIKTSAGFFYALI